MAKEISQSEKEQILTKTFSDQSALLRQFEADNMVEQGVAKNFRDAVKKIKAKELSETQSSNKTALSGQDLDLKNFIDDSNSK